MFSSMDGVVCNPLVCMVYVIRKGWCSMYSSMDGVVCNPVCMV